VDKLSLSMWTNYHSMMSVLSQNIYVLIVPLYVKMEAMRD
jgi:hypothetical protein